MSRGHHITKCQYCLKEYVCGDCITNDCEMGREREKCPGFTKAIQKQKAANRLLSDLRHAKSVELISNVQLADELRDTVWAELKFGTRQLALVAEAIERLKAKG